MDKTKITKQITKIVVGNSVAFTTANIITANTHITKTHHKVYVYVAAFTLGWMVSEKAEEFTDMKIDEIIAAWNEVKTQTANQS